MLKRAVLFSIDAMLALISAIILIGIAFFYLSSVETLNWSQPGTFITAMDTLNVLRIDNTFSESIRYSSNESLILFMDNMFAVNICGRIELYNSTGNLLIDANKTNCLLPNQTNPADIYVSRRTFVYNKNMYYAFLRLWYV
jgi:uncharacterized membrane protein